MHVDNRKKDVLILGKGPTDWLDDITLLYANGIKIYRFKAKHIAIVFEIAVLKIAQLMYLSNILNDFADHNMKKTELDGYMYDLSTDYDTFDVNDIVNINKCSSMAKSNIK